MPWRRPALAPTPEGRSEGERLLAAEVDIRAVRGPLTQAYQTFLGLNGPLLRVCTDWQLRNADPNSLVVNDHTDDVYDQTVLERLDALRRRILPICGELAAALPRLGHYGTRLSSVEGVDQFHAVWFELHEDFLATLGLDRSTEPLPDTGA